ncbi:RNA polymerase sigma factor [Paenibacillus donghaensis]|nr:sigma-70 family RNA polymerase sigma factor [Paenibacillus donghaensis]
MNKHDNTCIRHISPRFLLLDYVTQREVFSYYTRMNFNLVLSLLHDDSAVEDVLQEAFLKLIRNTPMDLKDHCRGAWIKKTTRNTALNFIRKAKKERSYIDIDSMYARDFIISPYDLVEKEVEVRILKENINLYLEELKPQQRNIIQQRWQQEYSYQEIANKMSISEEVTQQRLYRARVNLRKKMKWWLN